MRYKVTNAVRLHLKLLKFAWDHEFKILDGGLFPVFLGLDFLTWTQMVIDVSSKRFSFRFHPSCVGDFSTWEKAQTGHSFLQSLTDEVSQWSKEANGLSILAEFLAVFPTVLGTADCAPYVIELTDSIPVHSAPYRCAPPKLVIFKNMVNELLTQGVVRPSKSPYASPAFLVPKSGGSYRMEVDYCKVNSKIVFDSYPMPTIEEALDQFANAAIFSVLDLNSAYYQIPLAANSRGVTAFCTPFGLYEFNKLPMGISVGPRHSVELWMNSLPI